MSKSKKIMLSIFLALLLCCLIFCTIWCVCNFDLVKKGLSGTQLYTKEDIDKAFDDGSKQAFKEKQEYLILIEKYKEEIITLNDIIDKDKISIKEKDDTIANLSIKLNSAELLKDEYKEKLELSTSLNSELQEKYELEQSKVTSLSNEILRLKSEKTELQLNLTNAQNRIAELNQTILGYETFIQGLLAENQVVAKFYYDNSLYSVMVLQKGDKANVSKPSDTTYKKFLGWMVNNELVDVPNYPINENTTFVAKINTFHDVKFVVDNDQYDIDIVVDGGYSKTPTNPTKAGYVFDGWMIDNVVYDINTYPITKNTVFTAKFTKMNIVKFVYKDNVINNQSVRNNEYANEIYPELDDYTQFDYWMVNGMRVDIPTYSITSDVTFVAHFTNKYDVKFIYEDINYSSQIILHNDKPTSVTPISTTYKVFKGWSLDKVNVVDYLNTPITKTTIYYAVIDYYYNVSFMIDDLTAFGDTQIILKNSFAILPTSSPTKAGYAFDYWTLDKKNEVNVATTEITSDTIFYAKFTKLYVVNFYNDSELINSQSVRENNCPILPNEPVKDEYKFLGYSLNKIDVINNIENIKITSDINYYAVFKYLYLNISDNELLSGFEYTHNVAGSETYIQELFKNSAYDPTFDSFDVMKIKITNDSITTNSYFVDFNLSYFIESYKSYSFEEYSTNSAFLARNIQSTKGIDELNFSFSNIKNLYGCLDLSFNHVYLPKFSSSPITNGDLSPEHIMTGYLVEDGCIVFYILKTFDTNSNSKFVDDFTSISDGVSSTDLEFVYFREFVLSKVKIYSMKIYIG